MPTSCCVPGCTSNYGSSGNISCFKFPKDEELKKKWIKQVHRDSWQPTQRSVVCIKHFDEQFLNKEDKYVKPDGTFTVIPRKKITLKNEAYPTIFLNQPSYMTTSVGPSRVDPLVREYKKQTNMEQVKLKQEERKNIVSLENLRNKYKSKLKNLDSLTFIDNVNSLHVLYITSIENSCPEITASLTVGNDLSVKVYKNSLLVPKQLYDHILEDNQLCKTWPMLQQLIDFLKNDREGDTEKITELKLNKVLDILKDCCKSGSHLDSNVMSTIHFLAEQVKLVLSTGKSVKYSPEMLVWSCTIFYSFPAAYKFIRNSNVLELPHVSYLKKKLLLRNYWAVRDK